MVVRNFRELRAWQVSRAFKKGIYDLIDSGVLTKAPRLADQLREAAASATSAISEGYGRFDPADFARFVKMAKASLIECQNHLEDAVDRGLIADAIREDHDRRAQLALREIGGLLDYLQSPDAQRNAERVRRLRFERRAARIRKTGDVEP
jgi:four helix bundle protein